MKGTALCGYWILKFEKIDKQKSPRDVLRERFVLKPNSIYSLLLVELGKLLRLKILGALGGTLRTLRLPSEPPINICPSTMRTVSPVSRFSDTSFCVGVDMKKGLNDNPTPLGLDRSGNLVDFPLSFLLLAKVQPPRSGYSPSS